MKTLFCYLIAASLVFLGACDTKEEAISPSDILNITATPDIGQITLNWDLPEDPQNIFYVSISYHDHLKKKDKIVLASNKTDSMVIPGLLRRFGDYHFTLQTYSETQTPNSNVHAISAMSIPVPPSYVFTGKSEEIPLTVAMLSSNAQQSPTENTIADLIDRDDNTFFHSQWSPQKELPHWIDVTFENEEAYDAVFKKDGSKCGAVNFKFKVRAGGNRYKQAPQEMEVLGSIDGENFFALADVMKGFGLSDSNKEYTSASISLLDFEGKYGQRPKVFRFASVAKCLENGDFFTMAEFWMFGHEAVIISPETDPLD